MPRKFLFAGAWVYAAIDDRQIWGPRKNGEETLRVYINRL